MAALALPIISGLSSLFGGIFGGNAASKAEKQIVQADQQAQQELQQSSDKALTNQQNTTSANLSRLNPFLSAGTNASGTLSEMLGTPGQGLLTPWTQTFQAPTAAQAAQTPGYQFQLQQGENALQNSAAARGGLLSGQTLGDMNNYAQGIASTNYQNTFNNALTQYNSAYQSFLNNQANTYGMLSGQQGMGMNAAGQMGNLAQMGANNFGNITTNTGQDIAQLYSNMGAARAGGTLGGANALSGAISGIGGAAASLPWNQWFPMSNMNPSSTNFSYPGSTNGNPYFDAATA